MKQFVKDILPPIILKIAKRIDSYKYGWKGNYVTWHEAKSNSIGYNSEEIFFKVRDSMIKVKNGEATYERDSVIFDKIEYSWPILSGLMLASAKSGGELRVLDFGGSLGSTYYQNKKFFDELSNVSWSIVEQKRFVDIGKKEFEDNRLKFYNNIDECLKNEHPMYYSYRVFFNILKGRMIYLKRCCNMILSMSYWIELFFAVALRMIELQFRIFV